eukprot:TRINITY_DN31281_c0_g1_i1.p1 TRINITY_DN31281_c0_g1~~TRINITY_DN31281_c0_g1_i1.p1  ORF type:complete len:436 (-),score=82.21 TRINITY_DN31281_c0_g1_i1:450-1667(-)
MEAAGRASTEQDGAAAHERVWSVHKMVAADAERLVQMQDRFAGEHWLMMQPYLPEVTYEDWQMTLVCRKSMLQNQKQRIEDTRKLLDAPSSQGVQVWKAIYGSGLTVGYVIYQVCEQQAAKKERRYPLAVRRRPRRKRQDSVQKLQSNTYVHVKQVYVEPQFRNRGIGTELLIEMLKSLPKDGRNDIRLSCVDVNAAVLSWYRRCGFHVTGLYAHLIGKRQQKNVIVFDDLRYLDTPEVATHVLAKTRLFGEEVLGEVISFCYEEDGEPTLLRIVSYDKTHRHHGLDSSGLSEWDGQPFVDTIDLTGAFQNGRFSFQTPLCTIHRKYLLAKAAEKAARVIAEGAHGSSGGGGVNDRDSASSEEGQEEDDDDESNCDDEAPSEHSGRGASELLGGACCLRACRRQR